MKGWKPLLGWAAAWLVLCVAVKGGLARGLDQAVESWVSGWRAPGMDPAMRAASLFGSLPWMAVVVGIMAWRWWRRREWTHAAAFVAALGLGIALHALARVLVQQGRPDALAESATPMTLADRVRLAGFPSGHTFRSAFIYGWGIRVLRRMRGRWSRAAAAGVMLILVVGFTRLYWHRHWASDIVGGWALAMLALAASRGIMDRGRATAS